MKTTKPRLFYGVSYTNNEDLNTIDIFDNYDEANSYYNWVDKECIGYDLSIYEVENYYRDGKFWNYDNYSNTFNLIVRLKSLTKKQIKRALKK